MLTRERLLPPLALFVVAVTSLCVILTSQTLAIDGQTPLTFLVHKAALWGCENVERFSAQAALAVGWSTT